VVKYIFLFFLIISGNAAADMQLLRDPTKPLNYKAKKVNKEYSSELPKLQSILAEGQQQRAIINNKLYREGQRVKGYLISKISRDIVLLSYKTKTYKLSLYNKKERFRN